MSTNDTALTAYIARIAEIETLVDALAEFVDDHGGVDPDDINWSHVGTVTEARNRLAEVAGFLGLHIEWEPADVAAEL